MVTDIVTDFFVTIKFCHDKFCHDICHHKIFFHFFFATTKSNIFPSPVMSQFRLTLYNKFSLFRKDIFGSHLPVSYRHSDKLLTPISLAISTCFLSNSTRRTFNLLSNVVTFYSHRCIKAIFCYNTFYFSLKKSLDKKGYFLKIVSCQNVAQPG